MQNLLNQVLFPMGAAGGLGASAGYLVQHFFLPDIDGALLGALLGGGAFLGFYLVKLRNPAPQKSEQA